jgi:hypothetical protein
VRYCSGTVTDELVKFVGSEIGDVHSRRQNVVFEHRSGDKSLSSFQPIPDNKQVEVACEELRIYKRRNESVTAVKCN